MRANGEQAPPACQHHDQAPRPPFPTLPPGPLLQAHADGVGAVIAQGRCGAAHLPQSSSSDISMNVPKGRKAFCRRKRKQTAAEITIFIRPPAQLYTQYTGVGAVQPQSRHVRSAGAIYGPDGVVLSPTGRRESASHMQPCLQPCSVSTTVSATVLRSVATTVCYTFPPHLGPAMAGSRRADRHAAA